MGDIQDPDLLREIEDIRDEIAIKEGILESLEDKHDINSEDELVRKNSHKELKRLRKHLQVLEKAGPKEEEDDLSTSKTLDQTPDNEHATPPDHLTTPGQFQLASRKRQRDLYDDRAESSKSRRTTPIALTPRSPALSFGSKDSFDDLDDPSLSSLFGMSKDEVEEQKKFWRQKELQDADEKLAIDLSQTWSDDDQSPAQPSVPRQSTELAQSVLRNGSFIKPEVHNVPHSRPSAAPFSMRTAQGHTMKIEIKGESANPGALARTKSETAVTSPSMPGAFPQVSASNDYLSRGGSSVYGNIGTNVNGSTTYNGIALPGQLGMNTGQDLHSSDRSFYGYGDTEQTQEEVRRLLEHIRPDEELTANGQMPEQTPGLKVNLMPHQLSGVAWMKRMEEGTNKGGILADDMGLGKTLQAIALMLERPSPPEQRRPTLVVAPVALMQQWKREIEKMVRPRYRMSVLILHGETRKTTWTALKTYDVVITTYGLLASELKRKIALEEKVKRLQNYIPSVTEDCSILGDRSKFHRVILDEAHNIKNKDTKSAHAAYRIQAEHRWCLTGTPMMNNTEELYSLVKFLRIRPYCQWEKFRRDISSQLKKRYGSRDKAISTLQALLRATLLRRTKNSTIHGQPILQLPPKETLEDRVPFDQDQSDFYFALQSQTQIAVRRYMQAGTVGRHYANVLVLLLRLRQACDHPSLVVASNDFIQLPGGELNMDTLLENAKKLDSQVVERLKELEAYECPVCFDVSENPSIFFCGHAFCSDCLNRLNDEATNNGTQPKCPQCRANIDVNNVTDYTSFLRVHCPDHELVQGFEVDVDDDATEAGSDTDTDTESETSEEGDDLGGFIVPDSDSDIDADSDDAKPAKPSKKSKGKRTSKGSKKSKGKARAKESVKSLAQLRKEGLKSRSARRKYLKHLKKTFVPSAKTTRTLELLEEIKGRGENEKTIIFSNFTSFLDLVEVALYDKPEFSHYVRYDGSMSAKDRNAAVLEFTENPNCLAILVSLRAGNAGLNLTAANHVIMLDPFWNPFVEYQASDRAHRIGQMRPVTVHRVLIGPNAKDNEPNARGNAGRAGDVTEREDDDLESEPAGYTVEDRILNLQERKRRLVEEALDENAGRAVSRLGVRELGYLFGLNNL
jgi:SNF2 family DNA or RNA helicase